MKKREDIRKVNKGNSFYDVFEPRTYKDNQGYKLISGITRVIFKNVKRN